MTADLQALKKFEGKWRMDRSENADAFFSAMGMNYFVRKMAGLAKPNQIVRVEDGALKVTSQSTFMTREDEIKLGEEFEKHEEKMGVKFRCKARVEDEKLIIDQEAIEGGNDKMKRQMITREIIEGETVMTVRVLSDNPDNDVICKRWFKKIE